MKAMFLYAALALLSAYTHASSSHTRVFDPTVDDLAAFPDSNSHRTHSSSNTNDVDLAALLANMTIRAKAAQMTQMDIYSIMNGDERDPARALNVDVVTKYAKAGIGSILNAPFSHDIALHSGRTGWNATEWQSIIQQIQSIYRQHHQVPMLYGIDTIHGATYVRGATLFGQPLSAASSFNRDLVEQMGAISARDTLAAGIPWIFSPVLGIAVQPKWARVFETFGEDPLVAAELGSALIRGMQHSGRAAACMKHFIGYSNPTSGLDRADNVISDWDLVNLYATSFYAATHAGVKTAMEAYDSVNGFPVIANHKLLSSLLRHDMNFTGVLVSDYSEIDRMHSEHHLVATVADAVRVSLTETSLDMNMSPNDMDAFLETVEALVKSGALPVERLDASVLRILELKRDLGLFQQQVDNRNNSDSESDRQEVGSAADQAVALALARESVILLENHNDTLPLRFAHINFDEDNDAAAAVTQTTVFVTGPLADNKGYMCGGWSVFWQGSSNSSHFPHGMTFVDAVRTRASATLHVEHHAVIDVDGRFESPTAIDEALAIAATSDYTIVVLGESNYAEKTGDIADLSLPLGQRSYLEALTQISTTKVIVVLVAGRPRLLHGAHDRAAAVVLSLLPCEQGGEALADVVFGDVNPSAKLPITYPIADGKLLPYFHRVNTKCQPWIECPVEWDFGYGLSYSRFEYSNLTLNATHVGRYRKSNGTTGLEVVVTLTNPSAHAGSEVVLLFLSQSYRRAAVPERKLLKRFVKVHVAAHTQTRVTFVLTPEDWSYFVPHISDGFVRESEPGEFVVSILQSNVDASAAAAMHDSVVDGPASSLRDRGGYHFTAPPERHSTRATAAPLTSRTTSLSATFHVV